MPPARQGTLPLPSIAISINNSRKWLEMFAKEKLPRGPAPRPELMRMRALCQCLGPRSIDPVSLPGRGRGGRRAGPGTPGRDQLPCRPPCLVGSARIQIPRSPRGGADNVSINFRAAPLLIKLDSGWNCFSPKQGEESDLREKQRVGSQSYMILWSDYIYTRNYPVWLIENRQSLLSEFPPHFPSRGSSKDLM